MPQYPYDGNVRGRSSVTGDPMDPGMPHNHFYGIAVAPGGQVNSNLMGSSDFERRVPSPPPPPPFRNPNVPTLQRLKPPLPRQFQQQLNHPQAVAMGQQTQQFQQQQARQALMAQHAFHADMQNSNGVQRGMQPKFSRAQRLQQLGPPQHPQAQSMMHQKIALQQQQQEQREDQLLALEQQQRARLQQARQLQMQGNRCQIVPQEAEAQNVSHGTEKLYNVNQDNIRHKMMKSYLDSTPIPPPPQWRGRFATSERSSNIPEPTGKNRSIHATISKDHTAGMMHKVQSALPSLAKRSN